MKKLNILFFISLFILSLFSMASCGKTKLETPTIIGVEDATLVLSWEEVDEAKRYELKINDLTDRSNPAMYDLSELEAGEYEIYVRAVGDGKTTRDSDWSKVINFTREAENGLKYTLINNNTEYEVANMASAEGDVVIPEVYRNKKVTAIGKGAFKNKPKLTSIKLTNNIVSIADQAFYQCKSLTALEIPSSVQYIGSQAFQGCNQIATKIVIPDGIEEIKDNTFAYCKMVPEFVIPSSVIKIGEAAFADCIAIEKITISDNILSIGNSAFSDCQNAKTISFGNGITEIPSGAFSGCQSITEVNIDGNIASIGDNAFANCTSLTTVTISDKVQKIGASAFNDCTLLETVNLGKGIQSIGASAFYSTKIWGEKIVEETDPGIVTVGNAEDGNLWVLAAKNKQLAAYTVPEGTVGIADSAFSSAKNLSSMRLPNSVKYMGNRAFFMCESLSGFSIGSSVVSIGDEAFMFCTSLSSMFLGSYQSQQLKESSLETIGNYAFYSCENLRTIIIPQTLTHIGTYAFRLTGLVPAEDGTVYAGTNYKWAVGYAGRGDNIAIVDGTVGIAEYAFYNTAITGVTMADSVKTIGKGAFRESRVITADISKSVKEIVEYTFYNCPQLLRVNFEELENLEVIGRSAFYGCQFLSLNINSDMQITNGTEDTVILPPNLKTIGDYAFYGCSYSHTYVDPETEEKKTEEYGMDKLVIGDSVQYIGNYAFNQITSLVEVTVGQNVTVVGNRVFSNCTSLKNVKFGPNLTDLGSRIFYNCPSLESVNIPSKITVLPDYMFYNCESLKKVELEEGLEIIGKYAFCGCKKLTEIEIPSTVTSLGKMAFAKCVSLNSVVIDDNIETIDVHAFYGCNSLTIYTTQTQAKQNWNSRFNSSFRAIVWGVKVNSAENYVSSVTIGENTVTGINMTIVLNGPSRNGYTFKGWATSEGGEVKYSAADIDKAVVGETLYSVWEESVDNPEDSDGEN